ICIVIGEGASGGALGIGIGDRVYMMQNTWYSVISPESCSSILYRSWDQKEKAAESLKLTAEDMLNNGLIDGIIDEPVGGDDQDAASAEQNVKTTVLKELAVLTNKDAETLVSERIDNFSNMGVVVE